MLLWLLECTEVINLRSNVRRQVVFVPKDFYPSGLEDAEYMLSLKIGCLLEGAGSEEQTR